MERESLSFIGLLYNNSMLGREMNVSDALETNPFVSTFGFAHLTMPATPSIGILHTTPY
jgi:hypothetical protein